MNVGGNQLLIKQCTHVLINGHSGSMRILKLKLCGVPAWACSSY